MIRMFSCSLALFICGSADRGEEWKTGEHGLPSPNATSQERRTVSQACETLQSRPGGLKAVGVWPHWPIRQRWTWVPLRHRLSALLEELRPAVTWLCFAGAAHGSVRVAISGPNVLLAGALSTSPKLQTWQSRRISLNSFLQYTCWILVFPQRIVTRHVLSRVVCLAHATERD